MMLFILDFPLPDFPISSTYRLACNRTYLYLFLLHRGCLLIDWSPVWNQDMTPAGLGFLDSEGFRWRLTARKVWEI